MAEKDMTEKLLEDHHDVFADIINVLIFGGKQRVNPKDLEDTQTRSQYKTDGNKIHEQERDVVKYWKQCNVEFAICGLENQTKVE